MGSDEIHWPHDPLPARCRRLHFSGQMRFGGMRSVWKGSINFGLVNIPVAVYPATKEEKVSFKQLRKSDLSPVRYKKVAESDEKEVPSEEIVKGYEYEKGKWVVLEDKDFEEVQIESTHAIEITDFIEVGEVNPKYFYKPYFLEAQKGGEKSYALLHRAMSETGKIGIAKVAIRSREYLAAVKPDGLFLMLELMHFAQEVLEPEGLKSVEGAELTAKEIQMAKALVESLTADWEPEKYVDQFQTAVREMIEAKIEKKPKGQNVKAAHTGKVVDLLSVLQESLRENVDRKKTRSPGGVAGAARTTTSLVKQKRRAGSL
jgi:DNA end-binding protein Ku